MPFDLLVCDNPFGVQAVDHAVDCVPVPLASVRTATTLNVVGDATCSDEASIAKWAYDISAAVNSRVQVLFADKTDKLVNSSQLTRVS